MLKPCGRHAPGVFAKIASGPVEQSRGSQRDWDKGGKTHTQDQ